MMFIKRKAPQEKDKNVEANFAYQTDSTFGPSGMTNLDAVKF